MYASRYYSYLSIEVIEKEFTDVDRQCSNNDAGYDDYRSHSGDNASTFALATAGLLRLDNVCIE